MTDQVLHLLQVGLTEHQLTPTLFSSTRPFTLMVVTIGIRLSESLLYSLLGACLFNYHNPNLWLSILAASLTKLGYRRKENML
jgi:hypothetical protein